MQTNNIRLINYRSIYINIISLNGSPQKIIPEPIASYSKDFMINISFSPIELKRKSISELVSEDKLFFEKYQYLYEVLLYYLILQRFAWLFKKNDPGFNELFTDVEVSLTNIFK